MEPICDYCNGTGHVRYDGKAFVPCADVHIEAGPCHVCDNTGSPSEAAMHWHTIAQAAQAELQRWHQLTAVKGHEAKALSPEAVLDNMLAIFAELDDKDAEINRLRADLAERTRQRDHEAWMHAACLTIAETGEKWGDGVQPSLAMREVWELRQCRDQLRDDRKDLCEERARLRADLAALRAVVLGLPEYRHTAFCGDNDGRPCTCGETVAIAALAAAKKMAGSRPDPTK